MLKILQRNCVMFFISLKNHKVCVVSHLQLFTILRITWVDFNLQIEEYIFKNHIHTVKNYYFNLSITMLNIHIRRSTDRVYKPYVFPANMLRDVEETLTSGYHCSGGLRTSYNFIRRPITLNPFRSTNPLPLSLFLPCLYTYICESRRHTRELQVCMYAGYNSHAISCLSLEAAVPATNEANQTIRHLLARAH